MAAGDTPMLATDALASLEERILRAVQLVSQLLREKEAAEAAAGQLVAENHRLTEELESLRADRNEVRARIERLLSQLDNLSV